MRFEYKNDSVETIETDTSIMYYNQNLMKV
jgi:hypothetical protein